MKVGVFNQEKALLGAVSVIVKTSRRFVPSSIINPNFVAGTALCECNSYLHNGRGNCKEQSASGCGAWCYVNQGSGCYDARPSSYGAPYSWSCEACRLREEGQGEY